jgi:mono/diheme cytochrome c family protein
MVDKAGNDVSVDTFWRGSMMANAARDPYWQASVRIETDTHPDYQAVLEEKCAQCHMPMANVSAAAAAGQGSVLDDGFANPDNALHALAIDGVSCTLCHQILDENLEADSHSGGFAIDTVLPAGEREVFGPHPVAPGQGKSMQSASGFVPIESLHVEQAALCATCHTLYTPYVDAAGEIAGEFPEQMAYFEWLASSFGGTVTCQICHMPGPRTGPAFHYRRPPAGADPPTYLCRWQRLHARGPGDVWRRDGRDGFERPVPGQTGTGDRPTPETNRVY